MLRLSTSHSATANMKRQHIIDEIKRTAAANGGAPLGVARFLQETGIKVTDWEGRFWVRWGDALREAGFEPNQFNAAYDKTMLIEIFVSLVFWERNNSLPKKSRNTVRAGTAMTM